MTVRLATSPAQPLTTRRVLVALLASALVLLCAGRADPQGATSSPDVMTIPAHCAEDDPCWDCETMGNHVCGPASTSEEGATP